MKVSVYRDAASMGEAGAALAAEKINQAIAQKGEAAIILSTGASQFALLQALREKDIDWGKVNIFHLDEYVALPESHPASFRKYLKERFPVPSKTFHYINGEGDTTAEIAQLTTALRAQEVDLAIIGIGENAHIAFNDPPANFDTREAYQVVALEEKCKAQQVGEGWFATTADVPELAITMTPYQIMQAKAILSFVPDVRKTKAVKDTLASAGPDPMVPSSLLVTHPDLTLLLDQGSAELLDQGLRQKFNVTEEA